MGINIGVVVVTIETLRYERALARDGLRIVAGVDEVGRGALAGPILAAAVVLPSLDEIERDAVFWSRVRDSKLVTPAARPLLAEGIRERALGTAWAAIDNAAIDDIGIAAANRIAMERAVDGLDSEPECLLLDAMTIDSSIWQIGLIDGDALSLSIAAASIVAKVERDRMMVEAADSFPVYGFDRHKGYGVPAHLAALRAHGSCRIHRHSFAPVRSACVSTHAAS